MAQLTNISGVGIVINLVADKTYPNGLTLSQFSDEGDPVVLNDVRIADTSVGLNGDLLKWQKAVQLPLSLSVVPGSTDDVNLQILADANRVAQGKTSANDTMTATIIYPDGSTVVLQEGAFVETPIGKSVQASGRLRSNTYHFIFANKS